MVVVSEIQTVCQLTQLLYLARLLVDVDLALPFVALTEISELFVHNLKLLLAMNYLLEKPPYDPGAAVHRINRPSTTFKQHWLGSHLLLVRPRHVRDLLDLRDAEQPVGMHILVIARYREVRRELAVLVAWPSLVFARGALLAVAAHHFRLLCGYLKKMWQILYVSKEDDRVRWNIKGRMERNTK